MIFDKLYHSTSLDNSNSLIMKVLLFVSCLFFFLHSSLNAQITVTHSKATKLTKSHKAPSLSKNSNSKKIISSLKRTVKIIPDEKKSTTEKKNRSSKRKSNAINDDDIPF